MSYLAPPSFGTDSVGQQQTLYYSTLDFTSFYPATQRQAVSFYANQASYDFLQYKNYPGLSGTFGLQTNTPDSKRFAMCLSCGKDYGRKQDFKRHLGQCVMRIPGLPSDNQALAGLTPWEEGYALFDDAMDCWVRPTIRGGGQHSVVPYTLEYQRSLLSQWQDATTVNTYMWQRAQKRQERLSRTSWPL